MARFRVRLSHPVDGGSDRGARTCGQRRGARQGEPEEIGEREYFLGRTEHRDGEQHRR